MLQTLIRLWIRSVLPPVSPDCTSKERASCTQLSLRHLRETGHKCCCRPWSPNRCCWSGRVRKELKVRSGGSRCRFVVRIGSGLLGSERFDSGPGADLSQSRILSVCVGNNNRRDRLDLAQLYLDDTARCSEAAPLLSSGIPCCGIGAMNAVLVRGQGTLAQGPEVSGPGADARSQTESAVNCDLGKCCDSMPLGRQRS